MNAGKKYTSGLCISCGISTINFQFDQPLHPHAELTLVYGSGANAL
jgi:hypothetical protein